MSDTTNAALKSTQIELDEDEMARRRLLFFRSLGGDPKHKGRFKIGDEVTVDLPRKDYPSEDAWIYLDGECGRIEALECYIDGYHYDMPVVRFTWPGRIDDIRVFNPRGLVVTKPIDGRAIV